MLIPVLKMLQDIQNKAILMVVLLLVVVGLVTV
jgi:hypothetical protein